MMECPVCGRRNPDEDLAECPQCNADLQCFKLLDALEEPKSTTRVTGARSRRATGQRLWPVTLVVLFSLPLLFLAHQWWVKTSETAVPVIDTSGIDVRLEELAYKLERMEKVAGTLEGLASTLAARPDPAPVSAPEPELMQIANEDPFVSHAVADRETLWSIAERYYGEGFRYPLLIEHNARLGVQVGPHVGRIKILKDRKAAIELFNELSFRKGGRRFFRYKVNEGDTWPGIAGRFYRNPAQADLLRELNPAANLKAGERVTVRME
jgi:hypothetical protein